MTYDPKLDGVDHINIYSQGKTELGRMLSNFYRHPFEFTCGDYNHLGAFHSIEGLWYWIQLYNPTLSPDSEHNRRVNVLRGLWGSHAKEKGRELRRTLIGYAPEPMHERDFRHVIGAAMVEKVATNDMIARLMHESTLPFTHYYVYNGKIVETDSEWILKEWERMRSLIKKLLKDGELECD
ncbi:hypothetical protein VPHK469_0053 [Vibrio phage K469]